MTWVNNLLSGLTIIITRFRTILRGGKEWLPVLILVVLSIISWLPRMDGPLDLRWDGGTYYVLGTSLAEGKGYRLLNEPGEIQSIQYPPLFPAIIAFHQWVCGTSDPNVVGYWMRWTFFFCFLAYILAIYHMARHYLPIRFAFIVALLCLLNLHTYYVSDLCFPEIPFALITVLFVIIHKKTSNNRGLAITGFLGISAYLLRTLGIALLAAWIAESLFNKEFKKTAIRFVIAMIPLIGWLSYIHFVESSKEYKNPEYAYQRADYLFYNVSYTTNLSLKDAFSPELGYVSTEQIVQRVTQNTLKMPFNLGEAVSTSRTVWELPWGITEMPFPVATPWPVHLILLVLGALILGGIIVQLINREWFIAIYVLVYIAGLSLAPWPGQMNRYLVPLAPFLALALVKMLEAIHLWSKGIRHGSWKKAVWRLGGLLLIAVLTQQTLTFFVAFTRWHKPVVYHDLNGNKVHYNLFFYHDRYRALDTALDWLKTQANPDDIVAASMPQWVYLRTGLKAVMPPFETDPEKARQLLDSVPVSYLIVDKDHTRKYSLPIAQNSPQHWQRVYSVPVIAEKAEGEPEGDLEIYERKETPVLPGG